MLARQTTAVRDVRRDMEGEYIGTEATEQHHAQKIHQ